MSRMPERCYSDLESDHQPAPQSEDQPCRVLSLSTESIIAFAPIETSFFQEGEALSAEATATDNLDDPTLVCRKRPKLHKRTLLAFVGVTAVAACTTLAVSHMETAPRPLYPDPTTSEEPTPTPSSPTETTATTHNSASDPSSATAPALPYPLPSPSPIAAGAVADSNDDAVLIACKKAYDQRRAKDVLASCAQAFAADPTSADVALMLAKTEFERGRVRPASEWASKTIALDSGRAEAYVFLGGAEQAAGHHAAAKAAYKRYLQLSPRGRYAAELRAVIGSL